MSLSPDEDFWAALEDLIAANGIAIGRPKGWTHPRHPAVVYGIDYGYIRNTSAMDGEGIDVWRGEDGPRRVVGMLSTVDVDKRDAETKVLFGCSDAEIGRILAFYNASPCMRAVLVRR